MNSLYLQTFFIPVFIMISALLWASSHHIAWFLDVLHCWTKVLNVPVPHLCMQGDLAAIASLVFMVHIDLYMAFK
jgi:hypothetical protein